MRALSRAPPSITARAVSVRWSASVTPVGVTATAGTPVRRRSPSRVAITSRKRSDETEA